MRIEAQFEAHFRRFQIAEGCYQDFNGSMQENMDDFAGLTAILDVVDGCPYAGRSSWKSPRK